MNETDILYEKGNYWTAKDKEGYFIVYKNTITHAEGMYRIDPESEDGRFGLPLAISTCDSLHEKELKMKIQMQKEEKHLGLLIGQRLERIF